MTESGRISNDYWGFIISHPGCSPGEAMYYAKAKENARWGMSTPPYEGTRSTIHPDVYIKKGSRYKG